MTQGEGLSNALHFRLKYYWAHEDTETSISPHLPSSSFLFMNLNLFN